jgi:hypothetical protein
VGRGRGETLETEEGRGMSIQMVEVNQESLHFERMIEIKEKEIEAIKNRMQGALQVQE